MRYKSVIIQKFIGLLIKRGKKEKAVIMFENLLSFLKRQKHERPLMLLIQSLKILKPEFVLLKMGRKRKPIFLPKVLNLENQYKQSMNWIIKFSRKKKNDSFQNVLNQEALNILMKRGEALKERNNVYKLLLNSRPYLYLTKWN